MKKKCKVVILATERTSDLYIWYDKLEFSKLDQKVNCQHLYITSDDEIKEGDWVIETLNKVIFQVKNSTNDYRDSTFKKIISTTDKSIDLPEIPQSFINQYIESYNKGNVITEVMVEYEQFFDICPEIDDVRANYKAKINPDNVINISTIKDSWNREEVIEIIKIINSHSKESVNKWIEQNL